MSLSPGGVIRRAKIVGAPGSVASVPCRWLSTLLGSALDAPAAGAVTCPVVQRPGGGRGTIVRPAGTSSLSGLWDPTRKGTWGSVRHRAIAGLSAPHPHPLLMDLMWGCSVPMERVAGLRVAGPGWHTRFPGLGPSAQFRLDEEQMCACTPGPPALLLPSFLHHPLLLSSLPRAGIASRWAGLCAGPQMSL